MEEELELDRLITISYGDADGKFVTNDSARANAREALKLAFDIIGYRAYIEKHRSYLRSKGFSEEHIEAQISKVNDLNLYFHND